jgi:hypothetical protein
LLARAILVRKNARWRELLEAHDSFYIGSDVFYTFLVRNGCWWVRKRQRDPRTFLEGAETGRQRILTGTFPDYIERQFDEVLDYFGQYLLSSAQAVCSRTTSATPLPGNTTVSFAPTRGRGINGSGISFPPCELSMRAP